MQSPEKSSEASGTVARLINWFDSRLGLSHPLLRPVPQYAINPFYWLGALAVVAFAIQAVTGIIMMLYYLPTPTQAYSSTQYIFNNVYYGRFIETIHLYTAYAMIMLAFMHLMRGYFVSVHKKPREIMWIVGMLMGFVTLGFGFTGYLLPWDVVSKSATDIGVGMIDALPPQISSFLSFLIVGAGGDATELLRFYDLHVVLLPAVLLVLLVVKMYMLETHGISEPVTGKPITEKDPKARLIPIFPNVTLYLLELAAFFGAAMLVISVVFPLDLPPKFTPELAAQSTPQPDWYFLWIYQILKISIFEGPGLPIALSAVTLIFIALFLLPFIDRGKQKRIGQRQRFVTLGVLFVAELIVLAYWGLLTPGRIIPVEQAVLVLGGTALLVILGSFILYRIVYSRAKTRLLTGKITPSLQTAQLWTGGLFVVLLGTGALAIGGLFDSVTQVIMYGTDITRIVYLLVSLGALGVVTFGTTYLLYRLDMATGRIKRHFAILEIAWRGEKEQ